MMQGTTQAGMLGRQAMARLASAAAADRWQRETSETRLLAAVDNLRRRGQLDADAWWQARLAVVVGANRES